MSFGGESGLRKVSLCGIHPLTQRYVTRGVRYVLEKYGKYWVVSIYLWSLWQHSRY
ncbi:DUF3265 domain-containing protein [Vibrio vulnificus]|nr:DUF3265 domain-containing protein [Vibrio vulnificus]ELK8330253.1 DUF3265 domain-containing protein [Vibrio vulnificus]ELN6898982.1 DUF3265 domain-containing protein [Vibrio vulnificus]ELU0083404.1 DUF3265 domain-containing protein [Vibrio vulnificus]ELV8714726.1 DUF3265 domain-containing protein [Vibrio vulnificus]